MSIIGIDLGGTKLNGALFSEEGEILDMKTVLINNEKGDNVCRKITDMIFSLQGSCSEATVGICVPGIVWKETVFAPNIRGWEDYPLRKKLADLVEPDFTLNIESDRTCYILGEVWKGAAQGCRNAIYLSVGTGIAAGILCDGRVLHGADDIAGAIGWMSLGETFKEEYAGCGALEFHASGNGILKKAKKAAQDLFEDYEKNDPVAKRIIEKAICEWGMATANLVSIFNPEKIIFGGGLFGPAAKFIDRIREEAGKWAQPYSFRRAMITVSELKGNAGIFGAAYSALQNNRKKHT